MEHRRNDKENEEGRFPVTPWEAYLPVLFTLVFGLLLSVLIFHQLRSRDLQYAQLEFERDAKLHIRAFERALEANLYELDAVAASLNTFAPVSRDQFRRLVKPLIETAAGIQTLQWAPRVRGPERDAFVQQAHEAGLEDYRIIELEEDGQWRPAREREEYFPTFYAVTSPGATPHLGYDLGSDPTLHRALTNAGNRGQLFVESGVPFLIHTVPRGGVMAMLPVYDTEEPMTPRQRMAHLSGFVAGTFEVGKILDYAVSDIKEQGLDIHVLDSYGQAEHQMLAHRKSPESTRERIPLDVHNIMTIEGIHFLTNVELTIRNAEMGTRRWMVLCTPTAEYLEGTTTWQPWIGLGFVLYVTLLLVLYLYKNIARRREIEALVRRRTAELEHTNERLRLEIRERKRFEQERDELLDLLEQSNASLRTLNTRLAQSNQDLQDFAFVASHDLKEPLRKAQVFVDRLKMKAGAEMDMRAREYLELIQESMEGMRMLITHLLEVSRVSTHGRSFAETDLNQVLEQALSDLQVRMEETGAQVDAAQLPAIEADAHQIRQLFVNLIDNSLKYHRENAPPQISVTGELMVEPGAEPNPVCHLVFRDNGIGFTQTEAGEIFSLFKRLHSGAAHEGTGVGLAVCRKIVERHGGTISARGAPGRGASFFINLPVRHARREAPGAQDGTQILENREVS